MSTAPGRPRWPWVPWATVLVTALTIAASGWPGGTPGLEFDRDHMLAGEWWRLWTAHLVHFGASHLGWNLAVFVPAAAWAERLDPRRVRLFLAFAPGAIGLALLWLDPALNRYAGLSGVAAGVLALLALVKLHAPGSDRGFWCGVLALVAVKIAAETWLGHALFAHFATTGTVAVPLAHLAGVACAVVVGPVRARSYRGQRA
jgi:rhomboid family GlyGly-CTERM serine protease